jgi:hypothetical protein
MILTTAGPTLEKGCGESHVGLRLAVTRSHGKALTAFVVNKYPHMVAMCCCPGYVGIWNFVNVNVLDFEYHLARWCALLLSEVLRWVKAGVRERAFWKDSTKGETIAVRLAIGDFFGWGVHCTTNQWSLSQMLMSLKASRWMRGRLETDLASQVL